jgi:hypothetical protein
LVSILLATIESNCSYQASFLAIDTLINIAGKIDLTGRKRLPAYYFAEDVLHPTTKRNALFQLRMCTHLSSASQAEYMCVLSQLTAVTSALILGGAFSCRTLTLKALELLAKLASNADNAGYLARCPDALLSGLVQLLCVNNTVTEPLVPDVCFVNGDPVGRTRPPAAMLGGPSKIQKIQLPATSSSSSSSASSSSSGGGAAGGSNSGGNQHNSNSNSNSNSMVSTTISNVILTAGTAPSSSSSSSMFSSAPAAGIDAPAAPAPSNITFGGVKLETILASVESSNSGYSGAGGGGGAGGGLSSVYYHSNCNLGSLVGLTGAAGEGANSAVNSNSSSSSGGGGSGSSSSGAANKNMTTVSTTACFFNANSDAEVRDQAIDAIHSLCNLGSAVQVRLLRTPYLVELLVRIVLSCSTVLPPSAVGSGGAGSSSSSSSSTAAGGGGVSGGGGSSGALSSASALWSSGLSGGAQNTGSSNSGSAGGSAAAGAAAAVSGPVVGTSSTSSISRPEGVVKAVQVLGMLLSLPDSSPVFAQFRAQLCVAATFDDFVAGSYSLSCSGAS